MLRVIFINFILVSFLFSVSLEKIYVEKGIEAVEKILENNLHSKAFWKKYLKDSDVSLGYYEKDEMIVFVDKIAKSMLVYTYQNGKLEKKLKQDVIVGKTGDKFKEGDLKTPVGIYKITRRFKPQDQFYGPLAFSLSYPNLMDKLYGKDGYGIWIHGFPSNGEKRQVRTKGCVALTNDLLLEFGDVIKENKAVVIIAENHKPENNQDDIALILSSLYEWRSYWKNSDLEHYLSFYDEDFKRFDGMKIERFANMKKSIFNRQQDKTIIFSNIKIIPYPNLNKEKIFKISFHEDYRTKSYSFNGNKELYVKLENNKMKIIAER